MKTPTVLYNFTLANLRCLYCVCGPQWLFEHERMSCGLGQVRTATPLGQTSVELQAHCLCLSLLYVTRANNGT